MRSPRRAPVAVAVCALVTGGLASATASYSNDQRATVGARAPTLAEREAITSAYPKRIRDAPVECVFMVIRVSSRNPEYALAYPQVLNWRRRGSRCLRYAANGFDVLRKRRGTWRSVYSGSVEPRCPTPIPRDLVGCHR